jgi:hypothetical protein
MGAYGTYKQIHTMCEEMSSGTIELIPIGGVSSVTTIAVRYDGNRVVDAVNYDDFLFELSSLSTVCTNETNHTVILKYERNAITHGVMSLDISSCASSFSTEPLRMVLRKLVDILCKDGKDDEGALE